MAGQLDQEPDGFKSRSLVEDEDDVEGHQLRKDVGDGAVRRSEPDGFKSRSLVEDEDDVEGHQMFRGDDGLHRGGPSTQGEFMKQGPGDSPHGDR